MLLTVVWRLVTMVSAETARFSASGRGLADTTRPKVKAAKKKEAARANNIVAEVRDLSEELKHWIRTNKDCCRCCILGSLAPFIPVKS